MKIPDKLLGALITLVIVGTAGGSYYLGEHKAEPASSTLIISNPSPTTTPSLLTVDSTKNYAIFLTNGQVYFGKLKLESPDFVLTDIYYLPTTSSGTLQSNGTGSGDVSLVKLGNELHGPTDEMIIASQQVLFYEQLKDDGKVVKAIKAYESSH